MSLYRMISKKLLFARGKHVSKYEHFRNINSFRKLNRFENLLFINVIYIDILMLYICSKIEDAIFLKICEYYNIKYKIVIQKQNHMEYIFIYFFFIII